MVTEESEDAVSVDNETQQWKGDHDRNIVETLLHLSDNVNTSPKQYADEMCAWGSRSSKLRYPHYGGKRKNRINRERSPNVGKNNNSAPADWPGSSVDDYVPEWKLCVESRTCRYIINNGKYRTSKLTKKLEIHRNVRRVTEKNDPGTEAPAK